MSSRPGPDTTRRGQAGVRTTADTATAKLHTQFHTAGRRPYMGLLLAESAQHFHTSEFKDLC